MDFNAIFNSAFTFFISNFLSNAEHEMSKKEILIQRKWFEIRLRIHAYLLCSWNSYECRFWAKLNQLFKLSEFVKYQTHSYATKRRLLLRKWNLIRIPQFQPNRLQHNRVNSNLKYQSNSNLQPNYCRKKISWCTKICAVMCRSS